MASIKSVIQADMLIALNIVFPFLPCYTVGNSSDITSARLGSWLRDNSPWPLLNFYLWHFVQKATLAEFFAFKQIKFFNLVAAAVAYLRPITTIPASWPHARETASNTIRSFLNHHDHPKSNGSFSVCDHLPRQR